VTNGSNGCVFADWREGEVNMNIPLVIEQAATDDDVVARVEGIPGLLLIGAHGSNQYAGKAEGSELVMSIEGTIPGSTGNCSFTWSNDATATLQEDYLAGKIVYSRAHNGNSDCVPLTCQTVQHFNGTRPPRAPPR